MAESSGDIIGRAAVEIVPDADQFVNRLRAQIEPGTTQLGRDIGARIAEGAASEMVRRLRDSIRDGLNDHTGPARQGEKTAGYFADAFKAKLTASLRSLPKIELDANSSPADRKVDELRIKLKALSGQKIGVDITDKEAIAQVEKIRAELKLLTGKDQDISVRVNAGAAIAELTALRAAMDKATGDAESAARGGGGGFGSGGLLGGAILGATTLIGPLTAAATAGAAAIAADVGTAALAYKGLQREESAATVLGLRLQAGTHDIGHEFQALETIAAQSAGPGVVRALSRVKAYLPTLQPLVTLLGRDLGTALDTGAGGTITALKVMQPLLADGGRYADNLAQKWADFAASPEFAQFIAYARQELPVVGHDLADLVGAGKDLAVALQPFGDELLKDLDTASNLVSTLSKATNYKLPAGFGSVKDFLGGLNASAGYGAYFDFITGGNKKAKPQQPVVQTPSANNAERSLDAEADAARRLAGSYGLTVPAYQAAIAAQKQTRAASWATAAQLRLESDAGGLLKLTLDGLSGKSLAYAQAENQFEQALVGMVKHTTAEDAALQGMSSSAIQNRGDILNLVTSAQQAAEAYGSMDKSGGKTRDKLIELRQQIIDNAVATGENRAEVTQYIDSVLKIPSKHQTDLNLSGDKALKKAEEFRAFLDTLPSSIRTSVALTNVTTAEFQLERLARNRTATIDVVTTGGRGATGVHSVGGVQANAAGGYISGPGTGTSDSIPSLLSNGEYVVNAKATAKHRGLLENINAHRFADGGLVTITPPKKAAGAAAAKASAASSKALAAAKALAEAQANIRFTVSLDLSKLKSTDTAAQIDAAIRKLITDVHTAAGKGLGSTGLIPVLQAENARLDQLARERLTLTNKVKSADAVLTSLRKSAADEKSQVAGAIAGNFNITSLDAPNQFGTASPAAFLQNLQLEATQITNNAAQVAKLRSLGLNKNLIAQLGESGAAGFAATQSLSTADKAQIAKINQLYATVQASANAAGSQVSGSLYQAGIDSAEGYIKGLNSRLSGVNKAAEDLASTVVKQIRKSLGIASPAKVLRIDGQHTGEGFALGMEDKIARVSSAAGSLSNAASLANAVANPGQFSNPTTPGAPLIGQLVMQPGIDPYTFSEDVSRRIARKVRA